MAQPEAATATPDAEAPDTAVRPFDPAQPYMMHPRVALRPEPFGAMAYHYGNRRLNFLRHQDLVDVVEHLDEHPSVSATLDGVGIAAKRQPTFIKALAKLAASEFLIPRTEDTPPDSGALHD